MKIFTQQNIQKNINICEQKIYNNNSLNIIVKYEHNFKLSVLTKICFPFGFFFLLYIQTCKRVTSLIKNVTHG